MMYAQTTRGARGHEMGWDGGSGSAKREQPSDWKRMLVGERQTSRTDGPIELWRRGCPPLYTLVANRQPNMFDDDKRKVETNGNETVVKSCPADEFFRPQVFAKSFSLALTARLLLQLASLTLKSSLQNTPPEQNPQDNPILCPSAPSPSRPHTQPTPSPTTTLLPQKAFHNSTAKPPQRARPARCPAAGLPGLAGAQP
ncbi:hypothetical protein BKA80DRAFT_83439 [Phyllosticta citrichinensis]